MKKTYEITYLTEIAEETWRNDTIELDSLDIEYLEDEFNIQIGCVKRVRRSDGRIDRYYPFYIDGKRCKNQYFRIRDAKTRNRD